MAKIYIKEGSKVSSWFRDSLVKNFKIFSDALNWALIKKKTFAVVLQQSAGVKLDRKFILRLILKLKKSFDFLTLKTLAYLFR